MKDIRDLRDPSRFPDLSDLWRNAATMGKNAGVPFHEWVDWYLGKAVLPDYPKHESMQTEQTRRYQDELQERAKAGDKYAQSLLQGNAWDEPT